MKWFGGTTKDTICAKPVAVCILFRLRSLGSMNHLCLTEKRLEFDELNGLDTIERDERYPIRVTLQYYKATGNGLVNESVMAEIAKMLKESRKLAHFSGSLVTDTDSERPTEWVTEQKTTEETTTTTTTTTTTGKKRKLSEQKETDTTTDSEVSLLPKSKKQKLETSATAEPKTDQ